MATDVWKIDRTGDQLAIDSAMPIERVRESMIDAAADLSLVEIKALFGSRRSIACPKLGWVLVTNASPADAVLSAALSDWTEDGGSVAATNL